jgi:uncharacterized protein YhaN
MRITALELAPYGHLAYARLELTPPAGGAGLHVIRGRNGAGKSTTMRALGGALFGIPRQTPDMHTHPGPALKIGLSLETQDGRALHVERRKRDRQSLFAPDGSPFDEALLREALAGLPADEFGAMFLLDSDKLKKGSEDLLAGRGLLGQALFGAALGFGRVHSVLAELEAEAQELWLKHGNRFITQQVKELRDARQHKRQDRLDPAELVRLQRELEETEREAVELKDIQHAVSERLERTRRHQRCLTSMARRAQLLHELDQIPPTPALPASFVDDVRAAQGEAKDAEAVISDTGELDGVNAELDANPEPGAIADCETTINELYQRAGESSKAAADLPRRDAELSARRAALTQLLTKTGLPPDTDNVDQFRIPEAHRARLDELGSERARLDQAKEDAKQTVAQLKRQLKTLDEDKPAAPALPPAAQELLRDTIDTARGEGDLDGKAASARKAAAGYRDEARRACAALPLWSGDVEALERFTVPTAATVQRFEQAYTAAERAEERLGGRRQELQARSKALEDETRSLADGPHAPTRPEVAASRGRRDETITALIAAPDGKRAAAARSHIRVADELADARAEHAEVAAARDRLQRDQNRLEEERAQLEHDQAAYERSEHELAERWAAHWPGLDDDPLSPREMRDWVEARADVVARASAAREQTAEADLAEQAIERHRQTLLEFLGEAVDSAAAGSLQQALRRAKLLLSEVSAAQKALDEYERDRARLSDELADALDRLTDAQDNLREWSGDWARAVNALGQPADSTPAQARAQLTGIDELIAAFDGAAELARRVQTLRQDQDNFAADASRLAAELAPDLADEDPINVADGLHTRAAAARLVRARRQQLKPQQRKLSQRLAAAAAKLDRASEQLDAFAVNARVAVGELDAVCEAIEQRDSLISEVRGVEKELAAAGAASVEQLLAELAEATPESLDTACAEDEAETAKLEARRSELERQAGALRQQLAGCGGDASALAAETEARAGAAVLDGYDRYAELTLAAALLRAAIERHRRQNEGPLLRRASELFARLSCGTMTGLTVVTNEKAPHIMGVLPDQREVPVDGMSTGQRDQLFLALRLASLERHFEHSELMPLILDDLLVHLDNTSARAALEILAELSRSVQILFFTHHDHLVTMARDTVPSEFLVEHEIGETARPALRAA